MSSLRSWWCEPEPFEMISTPSSASGMCGECGVKSSSQVSEPTTVSAVAIAAKPSGHASWPQIARIIPGSAKSSTARPRGHSVNQRVSR